MISLQLDSFLARFDKYIVPILINVFSKITHLGSSRKLQIDERIVKDSSTRNRSACDLVFGNNSALNQSSLKHVLPNLYQ